MHHHIIGSESLERRAFAPGYGAVHLSRRPQRRRFSWVAAGLVALMAVGAVIAMGAQLAPTF